MAPTFFFSDTLRGSSFGEPDGTEHTVELLAGNGHMILRVDQAGAGKPVDLLFTDEQAGEFLGAVEGVLSRLGMRRS